MANGRQTLIPCTSLTMALKLLKPTSTKWSMWMLVVCSSVFHRQGAPPSENVALSGSSTPGCAVWPGWPCWSGTQP